MCINLPELPVKDSGIVDSFQKMWGTFPEPVMLVRRDRTVLAVNDLGSELGIKPEIKCFSLNTDEHVVDNCRGCRANEALRTGRAISRKELINGVEVIGYWVPVKGVPDVYVHFGVGTAESIEAQRNRGEASACI